MSLTKPGDVLCDPFVGSGTTAAVAKRLGRNLVGCDIRPCQVNLALKRLAKVEVPDTTPDRNRDPSPA